MSRLHRILIAGLVASSAAGAQGMPPALVDVATVEVAEVALARRFVGTIRPKRISVVGAETAGRVVEYPLREGMRVEKGAVLAVLDTTAQKLLVSAKDAELRLSRQVLQELVNGSRPEEIAQAKASVTRDKADVELRQYRFDKAQDLFGKQSISEDDVKQAKFELRAAEARLQVSEAALALAEEGPRTERIEQAKLQVAVRAAELARLKDDLARHTTRAPFTGYVVKTSTELGERLSPGDPLLTLAELDEVEAVIPVPNSAMQRLRTGTAATVELPSLPAAESRFTGKIVAIVPQADERARTLPVKIRLKNTIVDGVPRLKAGTLAVAVLAVGAKAPTLLVPKDAIVLGGPAPMVYLMGKDGTAVPVRVEVGAGYGTRVGVKGDIPDGATIVVKGNERLRPGQKLMPRK